LRPFFPQSGTRRQRNKKGEKRNETACQEIFSPRAAKILLPPPGGCVFFPPLIYSAAVFSMCPPHTIVFSCKTPPPRGLSPFFFPPADFLPRCLRQKNVVFLRRRITPPKIFSRAFPKFGVPPLLLRPLPPGKFSSALSRRPLRFPPSPGETLSPFGRGPPRGVWGRIPGPPRLDPPFPNPRVLGAYTPFPPGYPPKPPFIPRANPPTVCPKTFSRAKTSLWPPLSGKGPNPGLKMFCPGNNHTPRVWGKSAFLPSFLGGN